MYHFFKACAIKHDHYYYFGSYYQVCETDFMLEATAEILVENVSWLTDKLHVVSLMHCSFQLLEATQRRLKR